MEFTKLKELLEATPRHTRGNYSDEIGDAIGRHVIAWYDGNIAIGEEFFNWRELSAERYLELVPRDLDSNWRENMDLRAACQPCPHFGGRCIHRTEEYKECTDLLDEGFDHSEHSQGCAYEKV